MVEELPRCPCGPLRANAPRHGLPLRDTWPPPSRNVREGWLATGGEALREVREYRPRKRTRADALCGRRSVFSCRFLLLDPSARMACFGQLGGGDPPVAAQGERPEVGPTIAR